MSEAAGDQMRPILDLLELALDDADQAVEVSHDEVADRAFQRPGTARSNSTRASGGPSSKSWSWVLPVSAKPFLA